MIMKLAKYTSSALTLVAAFLVVANKFFVGEIEAPKELK